MTIIRNAGGMIIHRSKNLRGMLEHARREVPVRAVFSDAPQPCEGNARYRLTVFFANGDRADSAYGDPIVAARFLNSRRSWGRLEVDGHHRFREEYASGRKLL